MLKPAYLPLRASAWADPSSRCECFSLCHPGDAERFCVFCNYLALNLSRCEKAIEAAVKLVELALAARNDAARLARDS